MSLKHRLTRLEIRSGAAKPRVVFVQVPHGTTEEQKDQLVHEEKVRLGIKDDDQNLVIYLLRFV